MNEKLYGIVDSGLALFVRLVAPILKKSRASMIKLPKTREAYRKSGIFVIRDHYYEPLFQPEQLNQSLREDRYLPGIEFNEKEQIDLLNQLRYGLDELQDHTFRSYENIEFQYNNGAYEYGDAWILYNMVRKYKPKRIIEIGSGYSTLMIEEALHMNETKEGIDCVHICIEPYEQEWLDRIGIEIIRQRLEQIDTSIFKSLEENDMLIIDSSHIIRPQGDVLKEYIEILPSLNKSVIVHIHDIFTPKDYLDSWIMDYNFFWNEQYLLEAFLSCNKCFKILLALNWHSHNNIDALHEICPILKGLNQYEPGAFWIQKIE